MAKGQGFILRIAAIKLRAMDFFNHFVLAGLRLWIANIFWTSGTLKLDGGFLGIGQGNWAATLLLFESEYKVPYLNYEAAAYLSTASELLLPIMLVLGLGARIAAFGLLAMTAVIEFTYLHSADHTIWALFLASILCQGPGLFSVDHLISRKLLPARHK